MGELISIHLISGFIAAYVSYDFYVKAIRKAVFFLTFLLCSIVGALWVN